MSRRELRHIIYLHGGVDAFADAAQVTPRAVYHWLAGTRTMGPHTVAFVRGIATRKKETTNRKEHP